MKHLKYKVGEKFVDRAGAVREIIDIDPYCSEDGDAYELDSWCEGLSWVSEMFIDYNFKSYNQEGNNKKLDNLINGFDETMEVESGNE